MVHTSKRRLTVLQQEIVKLLFLKAGLVVNQRAIAKFLDVSPPAVMKALPLLEEENILKIKQDKESKRWAIELNTDNHRVIQLKRAENLKHIYESGLEEYLEKTYAGATIVVFGSYSRGDDIHNSDIDLAVIGRKKKEGDVRKYEQVLERKIHINFYESWSKIHTHLKENLCNGIVLSGGVEL